MQCYRILKRNIGKKEFRVEGRTACFNGKESKQSEENEKAKANALAQSKYNEILAYNNANGETCISFDVNLGVLPPPSKYPPPTEINDVLKATTQMYPAANGRKRRKKSSFKAFSG